MKRKAKKVKETSELGAVMVQFVENVNAVVEAMPQGAKLNIDPTDWGLNIDLPPKCTKAARHRLHRVLASRGFVLVGPDQLH
jgi:hypothetical protein